MIYANNIDEKITRFNTLPDDWKGLEGFKYADKETREAYGFFELVLPTIDSETQYLGEIVGDEPLTQYTYRVMDKTLEEIQEELQSRSEDESKIITQQILEDDVLNAAQAETDVDKLLDNQALFPFWEADAEYIIGIKCQAFVGTEVKLYECVQTHTSQVDWNPPNVPALFKVVAPEGQILPWVQPIGAQDAYQVGDQVTHNGSTWESNTADNVWEPGVFGWDEL